MNFRTPRTLGSLRDQPRILICRLSAIGDCIHSMPLVAAIRSAYPRAHITWLVQPGGATLVRLLPQVDEVLTVTRAQLKSFNHLKRLRSELRARSFDLAIDPQGLTKSALPAWLSGARCRIGFAHGQAREIAPWLYTHRVAATAAHVVDKYLQLLESFPLNIQNPAVDFGLQPDDASQATIDRYLGPLRSSPFAVLNPGAGWDSKLWPAENYAQVACHLWALHQLPSVVVWSGEREHAWARQIEANVLWQLLPAQTPATSTDQPPSLQAAGRPVHVAPDTSLPELAALLSRAAVFVGSDTGPLHLAAAVGTPCIGMYGPTMPTHCGPYGAQHVSLQAFYQSGTSRERRGNDNRAMRAIAPSDACQACDAILRRATHATIREGAA